MAVLHLPVVPWGKGSDQLVPVGGKAVGELRPVVRLDALNGQGEGIYQMVQERGGGIGVVFLKGLHETPAGAFVDSGILEEVLPNDSAVDEAGRGNELHVYLNTLSGTLHLFVRLGNVLWIGRMNGHDALPF